MNNNSIYIQCNPNEFTHSNPVGYTDLSTLSTQNVC